MIYDMVFYNVIDGLTDLTCYIMALILITC